MKTGNVVMEFTDDGKALIIKSIAEHAVPRAEFTNIKYLPLIDALSKSIKNQFEIMGWMIPTVYACHCLKWTIEDVVEKFEHSTLISDIFEAIKDTEEFKKVLDSAEKVVVHIDESGINYNPTVH